MVAGGPDHLSAGTAADKGSHRWKRERGAKSGGPHAYPHARVVERFQPCLFFGEFRRIDEILRCAVRVS